VKIVKIGPVDFEILFGSKKSLKKKEIKMQAGQFSCMAS